jgi:hypothetical protein
MHPDSKHAAAASDANGNQPRQYENQLPMINRRQASPYLQKYRIHNKKGSPRGLPFSLPSGRYSVFGLDSSAVRHFALVHAQAETAIRIRTDPSLEQNRRALLSVVRQGNQRAIVALLALRPLHHPRLLAADPNRIVQCLKLSDPQI